MGWGRWRDCGGKGGAVRACDSLCVFARVLRVTLFFFSSVRVCDWDVCGWGVCKREDGGSLTQDV